MLNHAYTLLVNRTPDDGANEPGDEPIEALFRPVSLTAELSPIRSILIGIRPDRAYANYMARFIIRVMEAARVMSYIDAWDNRRSDKTYGAHYFMSQYLNQPTIEQESGTAANLATNGSLTPNDHIGKSRFSWLVELDNDQVTVTDGNRRLEPVTAEFYGGLSQPIPLAPSSLSVLLPEVNSASWRVSGLARPRRTVVSVESRLRTAALSPLWDTSDELGVTAFNMWTRGFTSIDRVAGVALAYLQAMERLRTR